LASVPIMNDRTLERMRAACQLAADTLEMVGEHLRVGMTTEEINTLVHEYTIAHGARPSPLNYHGFPKSVCTSVNAVVCHGIPTPKEVLKDGDIINIDVTSYFPTTDGFHGDTSATFYVGEPSEDAKRVTETARKCLELGIATVKNGSRIGDIGAAIQAYADSMGCSVVRDYVGHGIGREFHGPPQIPHYGRHGTGKRLRSGMVFTIEPMINLGDYGCEQQSDGWTVLTADRSLSAQFEHTIVVTDTGSEVLTARKGLLKHSEDRQYAVLGPLSCPAAF